MAGATSTESADDQRLLADLERLEEKHQPEHDFEIASQRLADADAEIARLNAEYLALPEKIRRAEGHFQEALRVFNMARERRFPIA